MKILVICDDFYHHGEVIEEGLAFLQDEYDMTYATDMSKYSFTDKPLSGYEVVIIAKDKHISKSNKESWLTEDIIKQLEEYASNGGGLIFLHAGCVLCKHSPILKTIAGCEFANHPEQCVVVFNMTISPHPITNGVGDFAEKDEHYFIDFTATDAEIFFESNSEHGTQPAGYTRPHGEGRVCVLTPGHNLSVFQNEQYKKIIKNAVDWCAKN